MAIRGPRQISLGDLNTIDLRQVLVDQANAQGIPPSIAIAVATQESGIKQWYGDGSLVISPAGAIGVMQLMPSTAAQLGVDPNDPVDNIRGGCIYLAQMYAQFGTWPLALAAYNWGPVKVQRALNNGTSIPASVQQYAMTVLIAAGVGSTVSPDLPIGNDLPAAADDGSSYYLSTSTTSPNSTALTVLAVGGVIVGVTWLMNQLE